MRTRRCEVGLYSRSVSRSCIRVWRRLQPICGRDGSHAQSLAAPPALHKRRKLAEKAITVYRLPGARHPSGRRPRRAGRDLARRMSEIQRGSGARPIRVRNLDTGEELLAEAATGPLNTFRECPPTDGCDFIRPAAARPGGARGVAANPGPRPSQHRSAHKRVRHGAGARGRTSLCSVSPLLRPRSAVARRCELTGPIGRYSQRYIVDVAAVRPVGEWRVRRRYREFEALYTRVGCPLATLGGGKPAPSPHPQARSPTAN